MLGSFRIRMLLVIVIVTLVGLSIQSGHCSKEVIEPVIRYMLKDYDLDKSISAFIENMRSTEEEIPTGGSSRLQAPCEIISIERNYGWYWNQDKGCQEFSSGVELKVKEDTIVRPILEGKVSEISQNSEGYQIVVEHDNAFYSLYAGLKEVLVKEKDNVKTDDFLGKTQERLYFEIRNEDGPLNPQQLFE